MSKLPALNRDFLVLILVAVFVSVCTGFFVKVEAVTDDFGDDFETAKYVDIDRDVQGQINDISDVDCFQFQVEKEGYYVLVPPKNFYVCLYDSKKTELKPGYKNLVYLSDNQKYYLKLIYLPQSVSKTNAQGQKTYKLSSNLNDFIKHINILQDYISSYYPEKTQNEKNLILLRLIRQLRFRYDGSYWNMLGGSPDENLRRKMYGDYKVGSSLYFFGDYASGEYLIDPFTGNNIDFKHLAATLNVNINLNSNDYSFLSDMAGWAGDLYTCIGELQERYYFGGGYYWNTNYDKYAETIIGNPGSAFPIDDILADIDAYNLACKMKKNPELTFTQVLSDYYLNDAGKRFLLFMNNYSYIDSRSGATKNIYHRIQELTDLEQIDIWPINTILQEHKIRDYTQQELTALGNAFFNYIHSRAVMELNKPNYGSVSKNPDNTLEVFWGCNKNPLGTLYQVGIFDGRGNAVRLSGWTSGLNTKIYGLQPYELYHVKVRAKAKYFDDIISDWYHIGDVSTGVYEQAGTSVYHEVDIVQLIWVRPMESDNGINDDMDKNLRYDYFMPRNKYIFGIWY